jgi:hypothetical protein
LGAFCSLCSIHDAIQLAEFSFAQFAVFHPMAETIFTAGALSSFGNLVEAVLATGILERRIEVAN